MSDITNSTDPILTEHGDDRLEAIAEYIESLTAEATLQIGAQLAKARDIFRYRRDEGGFAGWVETRLRYSRQTAYNLLHVHERFGGQEVSKRLDTLARSVLFLVSSPSCPPEARDQIIKQAKATKPSAAVRATMWAPRATARSSVCAPATNNCKPNCASAT
jgi:hypothetical protein